MSFKREGDDTALLQNLQRRRVAELLSTHIPKDEALLLKNGQYACTVCRHKPIFDTIQMLTLHRKSKKHLSNLSQTIMRDKTAVQSRVDVPIDQPNCSSSGKLNKQLLKSKPYRQPVRLRKQGRNLKIQLEPSEPVQTDAPKPPSVSKCVRSYLKEAKKKDSFQEFVTQSRLEYGATLGAKEPGRDSNLVQSVGSTEQPSVSSRVRTAEEMAKADQDLKFRMSGWKKDWNGQWYKDETAEFDSDDDEEPPQD